MSHLDALHDAAEADLLQRKATREQIDALHAALTPKQRKEVGAIRAGTKWITIAARVSEDIVPLLRLAAAGSAL